MNEVISAGSLSPLRMCLLSSSCGELFTLNHVETCGDMYALCVVCADHLLGLVICLSFWVQHRLSLALHGLLPILLRLQTHTEGERRSAVTEAIVYFSQSG